MMTKLERLKEINGIGPAETIVIEEVLGKLNPTVADAWLAAIDINGKEVKGTSYCGIDEVLSFRDFSRLYHALGYEDIYSQAPFGMVCVTGGPWGSNHGCVEGNGTCSPLTCRNT